MNAHNGLRLGDAVGMRRVEGRRKVLAVVLHDRAVAAAKLLGVLGGRRLERGWEWGGTKVGMEAMHNDQMRMGQTPVGWGVTAGRKMAVAAAAT